MKIGGSLFGGTDITSGAVDINGPLGSLTIGDFFARIVPGVT